MKVSNRVCLWKTPLVRDIYTVRETILVYIVVLVVDISGAKVAVMCKAQILHCGFYLMKSIV